MFQAIALFLLFSGLLSGQPWSGIIDSSRAINWSGAGVTGGIPARPTQCGSTIAAYAGSASTINAAIAACAAGQFVQLGAGTFNLSTGITWNVAAAAPISNVTLRGMGADQTLIHFSAGDLCGGYTGWVCMLGSSSAPGSIQNTCDWTSGYTQGATTITIANCGSTTPAVGSISNLKVGSLIMLDQVDQASDTGQVWNCATNLSCVNESGSNLRNEGPCVSSICNRSQEQVVQVTQCDGNSATGHVCSSGNNITISPGLYMPSWASGQLPQANYATTYLTGDGLEDVSIDDNDSNSTIFGVSIFSCYGCWVKGVRSQYAARAHIGVANSSHVTIANNYIYQNFAHQSISYGMQCIQTSDSLWVNNIAQQISDSTTTNEGGCGASVWAYNYSSDNQYNTTTGWFQASHYTHSQGDSFLLIEGNIGPGFNSDAIHGTHHFDTAYRNYFWGWQPSCAGAACTLQTVPMSFSGVSRYFNFVANVLGTAGYHVQYDCIATAANASAGCSGGPTYIFTMGFTSSVTTNFPGITGICLQVACSSHGNYDPQAGPYSMRWGNYDVVNAAVRWNTGEVPSSIAAFSNAVPTSLCTAASPSSCPASFFLASKPTWWGSLPWPAVGPDVTVTAGSGGGLGVCSGGTYTMVAASSGAQCTGGTLVAAVGNHAAMNPAMNCALNTMGMPPDGSGAALSFNANTCYTASINPTGSSIAPGVTMKGVTVQ